jgi:ADP-heptose:LPS heptosyltransferase
MEDQVNVIHLQNKLTLKETAALMERADLLICPDSGPMHMAAAVDLPVVLLLGPTCAPRVGPRGSNDYICIQSDFCCKDPCHMHSCSTYRDCIKKIPTEEVYRAVKKMLERKKKICQTWWRGKVYKGLAQRAFKGSGAGGFRVTM